MEKNGKIILTDNSTDAEYEELLSKPVETVFKVDGDYEYIVEKLNLMVAEGQKFQCVAITPGTQLFTMYGHSHLIIIENNVVTE